MRMIFTPRLSLLSQPTTRYASRHRSFLFFYSLSKTLNNENELLFSFFFFFLGYKWRWGWWAKKRIAADWKLLFCVLILFIVVQLCPCSVRSCLVVARSRFDRREGGSRNVSMGLVLFMFLDTNDPRKSMVFAIFYFLAWKLRHCVRHHMMFAFSIQITIICVGPILIWSPFLGLCRLAFSEPNNEASSKSQWAIWPLFQLPRPFFFFFLWKRSIIFHIVKFKIYGFSLSKSSLFLRPPR